MKRALLIATGTVGGLGAVLAVTPPQFISTQNSEIALSGVDVAISASDPVAQTPSAAPSQAAAPTKTSAPSKAAAPSQAAAPTKTSAPNKAAAPSKTATPTSKSASGTFTGDSVNVRYGYVQVKITVENGAITDAQAVQAPSGRNDRWTNRAVPILRQQTLQAQSAQISGASGASFTSYGWATSLASALAKAGL